MAPKIKTYKFNPIHLCYAFSVVFIWVLALGLQQDWFGVILLSIFAIIVFPVFEEDKSKK